MRYRLRTLLIVVTVICLYQGWGSYCRRMCEYHVQIAGTCTEEAETNRHMNAAIAYQDAIYRPWALLSMPSTP
jgi:hypothetical protein